MNVGEHGQGGEGNQQHNRLLFWLVGILCLVILFACQRNSNKTPVLFIDEKHAQLSAEATADILLKHSTLTKEDAKSVSRSLCWDWTNYLEENIASQKHSFGIIHPPINTEAEELKALGRRPRWTLLIDYMPPMMSPADADIDTQAENWSLSAPAGREAFRGRDNVKEIARKVTAIIENFKD